MNASYRLNTCKSRGNRLVAILMLTTGARVRNAYRICPLLGDSLAKVRLIPDVVMMSHDMMTKGLPVTDDDASD